MESPNLLIDLFAKTLLVFMFRILIFSLILMPHTSPHPSSLIMARLYVGWYAILVMFFQWIQGFVGDCI